MSSAYIVLKTVSSPVAIGYTVPHEVYVSRKDAIERARYLNKRAARCTYDVMRAPLVTVATEEAKKNQTKEEV